MEPVDNDYKSFFADNIYKIDVILVALWYKNFCGVIFLFTLCVFKQAISSSVQGNHFTVIIIIIF